MPIKTDVDHSERLISFELSGMLITGEMVAAVGEAFRLAGDAPGYDILSDNRGLEAPAKPRQIQALLDIMTTRETQFKGSRAAVVVGQAASYGMMRMLSARVDALGIDVGVFWNMEDAKRFLER